jgi:hypothetical protein
MQRQASIGIIVLALVLVGCPDAGPTGPTFINGIGVGPTVRRAGDGTLKLHPRGFGKRSYAAWKAQRGQQDSHGDGDHSLYFQKMVPTSTFAAGLAVIEGVEDLPVSAITGLSWEHRPDGHCGAGAPRWNLGVRTQAGQTFTVFLGCAAAVHTPGGTDDQGRTWIRDSYPGTAIEAAVRASTGLENTAGVTVRSLIIVFDEGIDQGPGFVDLDNITVEINGQPKVFTGPMDNAR